MRAAASRTLRVRDSRKANKDGNDADDGENFDQAQAAAWRSKHGKYSIDRECDCHQEIYPDTSFLASEFG
jgi:hypothetical protein